MLSTANITMQFGPKPLFENISVKFGEGNRYGLIGANGCGKSTFMKILGGDLEPSAGNVALEPNVRLGKLRQDQFAYEDVRVLDVVMMGHTEMWAAMTERDAIYANPEATDDDYMLASAQARERQAAANARAKERVAELQDFVRRFSANKSKARQATSRAKQIDKIKIEEFKPSSRQNPFIRFEFEKKLHNVAVVAEEITKKYERTIFQNFNLSVQPGERIAIIGENGAGKTTLLRSLLGALPLDHGTVKWSENANVGYMPQDTYEEFPNDITLMDWIDQYRKDGDDETMVRGTLGRLLFSSDDIKKSVKVLSGGEKGRMIWGKLMLGRHNVLLMDEPTNHMDMESIESLQIALEQFEGTLIFVSHDREFVSGLANRIIEVKTDGTLFDFGGNYEEFLTSQGQE
ncbi:ATP-binding cassette domain-containing protein [Burkholderia cenocepacia]|uniref:ABC transporter domain-containing protein n=1 Tax=Burkholderia cenocepacia TaxID=95486 RepID=A0A1V2WB31_9BURK|nr:ATP-binding cassette domain-containing protein [Burkholderia cenocepacia]ONU91442.1 hypothetical protein A8E72_05270 [Burkholderia cenocepacia]ONV08076.1 hypothetical protein A8E70_21580 [Burkholderia cenocepacia]